MTEYSDINRGAIWPNEDKTPDHPNWADFKGSINVDGVEYWVSAWKRGAGANPKAPSLKFSIQKKEDVHNKGVQNASQAAAPQGGGDFDSESIPF